MRIRFIVKKVPVAGTKKGQWRVYDLLRGSFPYQVAELGEVAQDHDDEGQAQTEADRLTAAFGYMPEGKAPRKKVRASISDDEDDDDDDED